MSPVAVVAGQTARLGVSTSRLDQISLSGSLDDGLSQYGDLEMGRFNEDGSFIGEYDTDQRRKISLEFMGDRAVLKK